MKMIKKDGESQQKMNTENYFSKENKQKLKEYQKHYREAKKVQFTDQ